MKDVSLVLEWASIWLEGEGGKQFDCGNVT